MSTIVIQLAKMGDLLQTVPLLTRLCQSGEEVTLLHNGEFMDVIPFLPLTSSVGIDLSATSRLQDGRLRLDNTPESDRLLSELRGAAKVINLNSHQLAEDWLRAIGPETCLGFGSCDSWSDTWLGYILSFIRARRLATINLRDIFRHLPGAQSTTEVPIHTFHLQDAVHGRIALQLGSRNFKRQWNPSRFARLANLLIDRGFQIVLTGSEGEIDSGKRFVSEIVDPLAVENRIGTTSLPELADLLSGCDLLVTGDTGTMHLAAHRRIPVCALFFGPAYAPETVVPNATVFMAPEQTCFPCDETALCPNGLSCQRSVTPEEVVSHLAGESKSSHAYSTAGDVIGQTLTRMDGAADEWSIMAGMYRAYAAKKWWNAELPIGDCCVIRERVNRELRIYRALPTDQRQIRSFELLRPLIEMDRLRGIREHISGMMSFIEECLS